MIQLSVKWFQRLKLENVIDLTSLTLSVPHLYGIKNKPVLEEHPSFSAASIFDV